MTWWVNGYWWKALYYITFCQQDWLAIAGHMAAIDPKDRLWQDLNTLPLDNISWPRGKMACLGWNLFWIEPHLRLHSERWSSCSTRFHWTNACRWGSFQPFYCSWTANVTSVAPSMLTWFRLRMERSRPQVYKILLSRLKCLPCFMQYMFVTLAWTKTPAFALTL